MSSSKLYVEPGALGAYESMFELIIAGDDTRKYETIAIYVDCDPDVASVDIKTCYQEIAHHLVWVPW